MNLELPFDHPVAQAIYHGGVLTNRVILTVSVIEPKSFTPTSIPLRAEVTSWTRIANPDRLVVDLIDIDERERQLAELVRWRPGQQ